MKQVRSIPTMLTIEWSDGTASDFASLWLRDNLREDRDPHSGQRLVDIADLPDDPRIRSALAANGQVRIEWEHESRQGLFDVGWLSAQAAERAHPRSARRSKPWFDGAQRQASRDFAWATLADIRADDSRRLNWLTRLLEDGVAFFREVPSTEEGIVDAMSSVGRICETNYGSIFDVRSVAQPENLAYSDLGLGLHTDNPYREPVPGFQALHALLASPDGGDSLFADGFALASHLREHFPQAFATLTQTPVPFLYSAPKAELYAERPLIQLSCTGEVTAVHYNSRSIAPLRLGARDTETFYSAYRQFAALLRDARFQLRCRLKDGDLVVFDNQRILHGRTGFSSAKYPRHLRGCYLTRDSVYGEAALLKRALEKETTR